jgi:long-chain acyl-CoA synthetase
MDVFLFFRYEPLTMSLPGDRGISHEALKSKNSPRFNDGDHFFMQTLTEKFRETAARHAGRVAVQVKEADSVRTYTYDQMYRSALNVAGWLSLQGVQKGDRIALILDNGPEWPLSYFGLLFSGAIAVPLDIQLSTHEIGYFLKETQAKIIFASDPAAAYRLSELDSVKKIVVTAGKEFTSGKVVRFDEVLGSLPADRVDLPHLEPDDLASILYTSGTTGLPKGVMLTHKNFCANFLSISKLGYVRVTDNFLAILPLHHSFPFMATLITPLFTGATITYLKTLKPEMILKCLKEEKVTILTVTPQVLQSFYRRMENRIEKIPFGLGPVINLFFDLSWDLSRRIGFNPAEPLFPVFRSIVGSQFRFFVCGGAKLDKNLTKNFFKLGFMIIEGYGLTETSPVVSFNPPEKPKIGSTGKALPGVAIKISNPDKRGIGQILIKGDNVMKGYYMNDEATRDVIKNSWFHSGDLGCLDSEGYLSIKERLKEIIVLSSGKNISPEEVEIHYRQARSIKDICVMAGPGEEKLVAVVVPDFGFFKESGEPNIHQKIKWDLEYFSESLPSYRRIRDFVLTDKEFPRTRLDKIKRYEVKKIYQSAGTRGTERKEPAVEKELSGTGKKVIDILKKETRKKDISLEDHSELDLGIDSLGAIQLMTALEEKFGIFLKEDEFPKFFTVVELIKYMEAALSKEKKFYREIERSWKDIFSSAPPVSLLDKIDIRARTGAKFFAFAGSLILDPIFKLFFRLRVYGKENMDAEPYLLTPNHTSYLDAFIIFSSVPWALRSRLFFLGYQRYFDVPVIRDFVKLLRVIPIDPSKNLMEALQASAFVLKNRKILCIFPEGARSISGQIKDFKKGAGILSKEMEIKVIPVYINGAHRAMKTGKRLPRPSAVRVIFGRPYPPSELEAIGLKLNKHFDGYAAVSEGLREEVLRLKKSFHCKDPISPKRGRRQQGDKPCSLRDNWTNMRMSSYGDLKKPGPASMKKTILF